jgi:hypothetical protein
MIYGVLVPGPTAELSGALFGFALRSWDGQATSRVVTAPNPNGIDEAVFRDTERWAGSSVLPGSFFDPMTDTPPAAIAGTNREIL